MARSSLRRRIIGGSLLGLGSIAALLGIFSPQLWPQSDNYTVSTRPVCDEYCAVPPSEQLMDDAAAPEFAQSQFLLVPPELFTLVDPTYHASFAVYPEGATGNLTMIAGRRADILGWLAGLPYTEVNGLATWDQISTEALVAPGTAATSSSVGNAASQLLGNDMWVWERSGASPIELTAADLPTEPGVMLLVANPNTDNPPTMTIVWPREVTTPYRWPLIGAGLATMLLGAAILLTRSRQVLEPVPMVPIQPVVEAEPVVEAKPVAVIETEPVADELVDIEPAVELEEPTPDVLVAAPDLIGEPAVVIEPAELPTEVEAEPVAESELKSEPEPLSESESDSESEPEPELEPEPVPQLEAEPPVVLSPEPAPESDQDQADHWETSYGHRTRPPLPHLLPPLPDLLAVLPDDDEYPLPLPKPESDVIPEVKPAPSLVEKALQTQFDQAQQLVAPVEAQDDEVPAPVDSAGELDAGLEAPSDNDSTSDNTEAGSLLEQPIPVSRAAMREAKRLAAETGDTQMLEALTGAIPVIVDPEALTSQIPVQAADWRSTWGLEGTSRRSRRGTPQPADQPTTATEPEESNE